MLSVGQPRPVRVCGSQQWDGEGLHAAGCAVLTAKKETKPKKKLLDLTPLKSRNPVLYLKLQSGEM